MALRIEPFRPEHLTALAAQREQRDEIPAVGVEQLVGQHAFTALDDHGTPIAVAGLAEQWTGRALAWAVLSKDAGKHLAALTRLVRRVLATAGHSRIEATADVDFAPAHRWLLMLGFRLEAPRMRSYFNGRDHALYAWVVA